MGVHIRVSEYTYYLQLLQLLSNYCDFPLNTLLNNYL